MLVSALVAVVSANGYGGGYGGGNSYALQAASPSYGGGYSNGNSYGQVVNAAIQTRHTVEYRDVPTYNSVKPTTIEVGASPIPIQILFRSASSNLNVRQAHDGARGSTQQTSSEDEPHRLVHSVTKPVVQEVREIITPFRKITQEIQPVQEEIITIVARGQEKPQSASASPVRQQVQQAPAQVVALEPVTIVEAAPESALASPSKSRSSYGNLGGIKTRY